MEFPERHITHSKERQAIEILSRHLPEEWIVRELTERDYGVDLYVEIVNKDRKVTGNLIAIQIKGTSRIDFKSSGKYTYSGIKRTTINYWTHLPVPVFFIVVCIENETPYWVSINELERTGRFKGNSKTTSIVLDKEYNLKKEIGVAELQYIYLREKRWSSVEAAMEKALMSFTSFGPFCLICKRKDSEEICSSTIQYLLLGHYENYYVLTRYLGVSKPRPITYWYDKLMAQVKSKKVDAKFRFSYGLIREMIMDFASQYREAVRIANLLVIKHQNHYFSSRFPFLCMHLQERPLTFVEADWFARYYWDEYENETQNIELQFFNDFEVYDEYDLINDLNI